MLFLFYAFIFILLLLYFNNITIIKMISTSDNDSSETLTQGNKFNKYKNKLLSNGKNNNFLELLNNLDISSVEHFDTYSNSVDKSTKLIEKVNKIQDSQPNNQNVVDEINNLEKLDADLIKQIDSNKKTMDKMLSNYNSYNSKFSNLVSDNSNYQGIVDDSKIVVSEKNYIYILWTCVAVVTCMVTIYILNPRKP
jgi:hypothetical protein